jgi:putative ABC transport system substrate-binding protein
MSREFAVLGGKPLSLGSVLFCAVALALACSHPVNAQRAIVHRIGVVLEGGSYYEAIDALKVGLKELGLAEKRDYVLEIRDLSGDPTAGEAAARSLEKEKVDVIFAAATSVANRVKRGTSKVPIVFAVGSDPVVAGLIESFARPGGRLTGVYYSSADLTAKRLDLLKAILPNLRRVVTFYVNDPANAGAVAARASARGAARQLRVEIVERPVTSVEDLQRKVSAFEPRDAEAFFYVNDTTVRSQAQFVIETMNAKKVPTMFSAPELAAQGALAGYGVSFRDVGRLSARYVQRILAGAQPQALPVESLSKVDLAVNVGTARRIGVTIPQAVRLSASEVIE